MTQFSWSYSGMSDGLGSKLSILVGLQVLPQNQVGLTSPCTSTPDLLISWSPALLSGTFQEAFAKASVGAVGSAEDERVSDSTSSHTRGYSHTERDAHFPSEFLSLLLPLFKKHEPQQPINPFRTHMALNMCFLVAWFLATEETLILLLDLCACLLFIMCKLDVLPWTGERETNDCHIVSSSRESKRSYLNFPPKTLLPFAVILKSWVSTLLESLFKVINFVMMPLLPSPPQGSGQEVEGSRTGRRNFPKLTPCAAVKGVIAASFRLSSSFQQIPMCFQIFPYVLFLIPLQCTYWHVSFLSISVLLYPVKWSHWEGEGPNRRWKEGKHLSSLLGADWLIVCDSEAKTLSGVGIVASFSA